MKYNLIKNTGGNWATYLRIFRIMEQRNIFQIEFWLVWTSEQFPLKDWKLVFIRKNLNIGLCILWSVQYTQHKTKTKCPFCIYSNVQKRIRNSEVVFNYLLYLFSFFLIWRISPWKKLYRNLSNHLEVVYSSFIHDMC